MILFNLKLCLNRVFFNEALQLILKAVLKCDLPYFSAS